MNPTAAATRAGLTCGLIELRQSFTGIELVGQLFWPVVTLVAIFFLRDRSFGASGFTLGTLVLPGVLGMFIALGALLTIQYLAADREDGTLLRAKAIPNGIRGYLIGKLVTVSGTVLAYLTILLIPGLLIVNGLNIGSIYSWLTLAWVLLLGLVATQSIGAILGALISSPRGVGYISLPVVGLIAISGIFYPITALPEWLQWTAQAFPIYWLGLGMRSALLPASAVGVEIGASWRHLETVAVLGTWAIAGLILAPIVLGRMARRESGSSVAERREKVLQRVG
ncbi:MAG: ABC transporter permease [Ktedonobacterales bacterium]